MIIKREIDGALHEFELTAEEMRGAFYEQERAFDGEDIYLYLENFADGPEDEWFEKKYGVPFNFIEQNLSAIVAEKREYEDNGLIWHAAVDTALTSVTGRKKRADERAEVK